MSRVEIDVVARPVALRVLIVAIFFALTVWQGHRVVKLIRRERRLRRWDRRKAEINALMRDWSALEESRVIDAQQKIVALLAEEGRDPWP